MGALSDFRADVRNWLNHTSAEDDVVDRWVKMAEERINADLRVRQQIDRQRADLQDNRILMPPGWLESVFVRFFPNPNSDYDTIKHGRPLVYTTPEMYWGDYKDTNIDHKNNPRYTYIGDSIYVSPNSAVNGTTIEVGYYRRVPPLTDELTGNWLYSSHYRLYLSATLAVGSLFLMDIERAATFEASTNDLIIRANDEHKVAAVSGNTPRMANRTFG